MKKAFYTCPFKAAYMAKHFGMKLQDLETSEKVHDLTVELMNEGDDFIRPLERYYIHPDSMLLLEMQVGDLIIEPVEGNILPNGIALFIDNESELTQGGNEIIIQRKGQPFIWPEFEDTKA